MNYIDELQPSHEALLDRRSTTGVIRAVINARNNSRWFNEKKAFRDVVLFNTFLSLFLMALYVASYFLMPDTIDFDRLFLFVFTPMMTLISIFLVSDSLKILKRAEVKSKKLCSIPFGLGLIIEPGVWSDFLRFTEYKQTFSEKDAEYKRNYSELVSVGDLSYGLLRDYQGEERDVYAQLLKQQFDSKLKREIDGRSKEFNEWFISMNRGIKVDWSDLTK